MDLLTQGLLGAATAQAAAPPREARIAAAAGLGAGLLADADALIQSAQDPLLVLEYHRHFTHALAFVPVGALAAALLLWPFLRRRLGFARLYLYTLLGYCLAGFLDACTSYGTHLFWPFSQERVAWSIIAIVDPLFSALLAVPLLLGLKRASRAPARVGLALAAAYLGLGLVQHERAEARAAQLAAERGHAPERLLVKPTLGNLVLWRSLYAAEGRVHADGIRVGLGAARVYPGESAALLDPARDLAWAPPGSRVQRDVARFVAFSDGLAALHPTRKDFVGDMRYAMLPTSVVPLWGVVVQPGSPEAAPRFVAHRHMDPALRRRFADMLLGR